MVGVKVVADAVSVPVAVAVVSLLRVEPHASVAAVEERISEEEKPETMEDSGTGGGP